MKCHMRNLGEVDPNGCGVYEIMLMRKFCLLFITNFEGYWPTWFDANYHHHYQVDCLEEFFTGIKIVENFSNGLRST